MYLKELLDKYKDEEIKLFVDMDGVIADYDVGFPHNYHEKRPLFLSIAKLEQISKMENVEMHILSISRMNEGVEQKNIWLDKFAPFFKKENRNIITREDNDFRESKDLKATFLQELERDGSIIILIDDDPSVLKEIQSRNEDVILLKDTVLVD